MDDRKAEFFSRNPHKVRFLKLMVLGRAGCLPQHVVFWALFPLFTVPGLVQVTLDTGQLPCQATRRRCSVQAMDVLAECTAHAFFHEASA